jgi:hypothetical protein
MTVSSTFSTFFKLFHLLSEDYAYKLASSSGGGSVRLGSAKRAALHRLGEKPLSVPDKTVAML